MADDTTEEVDLTEDLNRMSDLFDQLTQARHEAGQKEYGVTTFLHNDVIRMMAEELADTANYCRYQFIKLMVLQELLEAELEGSETKVDTMGIGSFRGAGKGWNNASGADSTN